MTVGGIDDNGIDSFGHQGSHPFEHVVCHSHSGGHQKPPQGVFRGVGFVPGFRDVFIGQQPDELVVGIDHGQLFYLVLLQYVGGILQVGGLPGGDKVFLGHYLLYRLFHVATEAQIAIGDDAHQMVIVVDHRDATYLVFGHHGQGLPHRLVARDVHRVGNHTVFRPLYVVNLPGLLLYRHVFVYHADTALASDGYGHLRLRYGVHGRRNERNVQLDVTGKARGQVYLMGEHFRIGRYKQHIVKGQALELYLFFNKRHNLFTFWFCGRGGARYGSAHTPPNDGPLGLCLQM